MSDVKQFSPVSTLPVSFSDVAIAHVAKKVAKQEGATGLRMSVKKAGCSGYMYVTDIVDAAKPEDLSFELNDSVKLFIDKKSFALLEGLHVDYVEKDLGLKRLVFINPNEKGQCGCGESFLV